MESTSLSAALTRAAICQRVRVLLGLLSEWVVENPILAGGRFYLMIKA